MDMNMNVSINKSLSNAQLQKHSMLNIAVTDNLNTNKTELKFLVKLCILLFLVIQQQTLSLFHMMSTYVFGILLFIFICFSRQQLFVATQTAFKQFLFTFSLTVREL